MVDPLELQSMTDARNELKITGRPARIRLKIHARVGRKRYKVCLVARYSKINSFTWISRNSSVSTKDTLISIKAKRAVLQERLKFTDVIKEQEKSLTKLKLEQELSETLVEEAIYEAEVNEESIAEPLSHLPKDPSTTLHRFLNCEEAPNTLPDPLLATSTSKTHNVIITNYPTSLPTTTSVSFGTTLNPNVTIDSVGQRSPTPHPVASTLTPAANTWTTFTSFTPRMAATSSNVLPTTVVSTSAQNSSQYSYVHYPTSIYHHTLTPAPVDTTQNEKVQHNQQLIEALAKVTQIQRLPHAKPDVFRGDEKEKTKYFLWERAFDALVNSAPVTDLQKLNLLYQHLDGRAKKVVEQLQYMVEDPAKAYTEARKLLKERFRHTAFLETKRYLRK